ncbi:MAG: hypothetical protein COZ47_12580 [Lysobacterales bacterium CG_4_10_14_3_um_filter_64_11]|nr:MAG: hypothetical protein COZ47_12580 [Xanthomonadales bacterium CG_4_10_14_3_um_filter_64_11]
MRRWLTLIAVMAALAMFLKFLPFRVQGNGDWIVLVLPVQATLALMLAGKPKPTAQVCCDH